MADTRVRQNTCYFVPPRREICSSAGEGWKIHCHWAHRYVNNSEPPVFEFFLAKRTQKCGSQLQENFACTVMQRLCSIHTKYFKNSTRNKIKIKNIIAEAVIGGLFQRCSALKLSNSLQLLLRKLISSQMSRKNLKVDQIWWKLLWYFRFVLWRCNNHCLGDNFW